jgi:kanamycin kinase
MRNKRCATWNIEAGLVDEPDVLTIHGISPLDLLRRLNARRPPEPPGDLVFVHGDYYLPNIPISSDGAGAPRVSGLLDWGRAGVSDRYQDLAIGARSLRHNLGPGWESLSFEAYNLSNSVPSASPSTRRSTNCSKRSGPSFSLACARSG